jgi:esterase/lipase superfamily enzyme
MASFIRHLAAPAARRLVVLALALTLAAALPGCGKPKGDAKAQPSDNMEGGSGLKGIGDNPSGTAPGTGPSKPSPEVTDPTIANTSQGRKVKLWYGTNRAMVNAKDPSKGYANERDPNPEALHVGSVMCFVPNSRPFGSIGSSWWTRTITGEDDRITLDQIGVQEADAFYANLRQRLAAAPDQERSVLVYIHGYKNSFERAARRAAQIAIDLNVPGLTAFYSWPSADSLAGYTADEAAVEAAERHLQTFLTRLCRDTGATRVNIIAHSMGNRVMARVAGRIAADESCRDVRFGQIILAAPDIDAHLFADLARAYPKVSDRTTLYVSKKDMALEASNWTHSYARAGYTPPMSVVPPIDTVEVTSVDVSTLGHGYVSEAQHVVSDIALLLRKNLPPSERPRLVSEITTDGKPFWLIKESQ